MRESKMSIFKLALSVIIVLELHLPMIFSIKRSF